MSVFDVLAQGRALWDDILQAAETAARLNCENGGRISRLASLLAQAAEEAQACFEPHGD